VGSCYGVGSLLLAIMSSMKNIEKERENFRLSSIEDFSPIARERLSPIAREDAGFANIDSKLLEAFLKKEMAKPKLEAPKLTTYQITIYANPGISSHFQMTAIPRIGDEVVVANRGGRDQVYRVMKVRHHAYSSNEKLESSANSAAIIWGELVENPMRAGVVF
jgi:hypothetical protein